MAYLEQKYSSSVDWVKTQQELLNIPQYPSFNPIYHQIKGFRRPFIPNSIKTPSRSVGFAHEKPSPNPSFKNSNKKRRLKTQNPVFQTPLPFTTPPISSSSAASTRCPLQTGN